MTTFDINRTAARPFALGASFANLLGAVVDWNERRVAREALNAMTDRQLDDLGLTRGEIDRAVDFGR